MRFWLEKATLANTFGWSNDEIENLTEQEKSNYIAVLAGTQEKAPSRNTLRKMR